MARLEADRREEGGTGLQVRELVLLVLVERHDAEVVLRGEPRDVGHPHGGVVLGDEAAEGVAELLEQLTCMRGKDVRCQVWERWGACVTCVAELREQLTVALEQRLRE